jgi:hypothetical protein
MQILSFVAYGLHGYINRKISFNEDVTYLTGINGTGKTSIVRSVVALLQPSLAYLLETEFRLMSLAFWYEDKKLNISAIKNDQAITVFSSRSSLLEEGLPGMQATLYDVDGQQLAEWALMVETLDVTQKYTIPLIKQDTYESAIRFRDRWYEFISEQETLSANNPLIAFLRSIPTPMFLGLERRSETESAEESPRRSVGTARRLRGMLGGSLYESILEARRLAEEVYRDALAQQRALADQLRKNIILAAFSTPKAEMK